MNDHREGTFQNAMGHSDEELPPAFTPYEAEYFTVGDGDIVSHDPHLNSDGEALYRFLLSNALTPPSYLVHCKGTHSETHYRWVNYEHSDGKTESRREHHTETITDFDFYIDIGQHIDPALVVHWSVADADPAFRGAMVREVQGRSGGKRVSTSQENKTYEEWVAVQRARGIAPWVSLGEATSEMAQAVDDPRRLLRSSKSLRQWADEYCESPKLLKEFVYEKVLYGWNIEELNKAIRNTIRTSPYSGKLTVSIETHGSKVNIRPDNTLSRILSKWWVKGLLWATLIYPFIWVFKRYHPLGGGRWQVYGGAYALKRWVPHDNNGNGNGNGDNGPQPPGGPDPDAKAKPDYTQSGVGGLFSGVREGEWFRVWQGTILRAVMNGYTSSEPLYAPDPSAAGSRLDGYLPPYE
ncbi:hypothetical protein CCMSSC00406_0004222 [Pleurotus cornucopiae]|uniref:Uncharacterized protein n=1 Tax=Pleurotus cornucopiae TaxID=5321 RepID=A0ACB7JAY7_PLECO|nr:hypothetical protein CCMSSC00406_0004222 [Pleurotus cornucopiae]